MKAFVALGSNVGDRWAHLRAGIAGLESAGLQLVAASSVWETEPLDTPEPAWFLNMVVEVETALPPLELLDTLLDVEQCCGRTRGARNAPRTLDLDLLAVSNMALEHPRLTLPHPRMWQRRFVLEPLAEIAPELRNPRTGSTIAEELSRIRSHGVARKVGRLATGGELPL